jgi:hypothetical protein
MSKKIHYRSSRCPDESNENNESKRESFQPDLYTNMSIVKNIYQKTKDSRTLASNSLVDQSSLNIQENYGGDGDQKKSTFSSSYFSVK